LNTNWCLEICGLVFCRNFSGLPMESPKSDQAAGIVFVTGTGLMECVAGECFF